MKSVVHTPHFTKLVQVYTQTRPQEFKNTLKLVWLIKIKTAACHRHLRKYSLLETSWTRQNR